MEHNYAVEAVSGKYGTIDRIETSYIYEVSYREDMPPPAALTQAGNGGPNYKTYLLILATLKPRKTPPVSQKAGKRKYGTVPVIR